MKILILIFLLILGKTNIIDPKDVIQEQYNLFQYQKFYCCQQLIKQFFNKHKLDIGKKQQIVFLYQQCEDKLRAEQITEQLLNENYDLDKYLNKYFNISKLQESVKNFKYYDETQNKFEGLFYEEDLRQLVQTKKQKWEKKQQQKEMQDIEEELEQINQSYNSQQQEDFNYFYLIVPLIIIFAIVFFSRKKKTQIIQEQKKKKKR